MRPILVTVFWCVIGTLFAGGNVPVAEENYPPPFVDIMRARHDGSFYDQQAKRWEAVARGECSEEDAWFHYYKTANYSNRFGSGNYDLDAIYHAAREVLDPEGFVMNYLTFVQDQNPVSRWPKLMKAYAADPERSESYTSMTTYFEITGAPERRNEMLRKLHRAESIPAGVMEYNHNQLQSVAPNGILLTMGDADTYPSWLLQSAYGVRPDVRVLNLALLIGYHEYRNEIFSSMGLSTDPLPREGMDNAEEVLRRLHEQNRPVFLAATGQFLFPQLTGEKLYIVGLAFQYADLPVNNLRSLQQNYTHRWRTDHLRQPLSDGPAQGVADQLNRNYLPGLVELWEQYRTGEPAEAARLEATIVSIGRRAGIEEAVKELLSTPATPPRRKLASTQHGLKARQIERAYALIPAGAITRPDGEEISVERSFRMGETEVTNQDYQLFLRDLLRQRLFREIDSASIADTDWMSLLPDSVRSLPVNDLVKRGHPSMDDHPILNVSHRGATLYAEWLTQAYNQDPKRRDGREVRFRLPTREEWVYAASAGRAYAVYPWGGPYFRNSKGCYLANFDVTQDLTSRQEKDQYDRAAAPENRCDDGGWLTVPVDSYYPNDFGLYQTSGNAAEMLTEPGKVVGGSWMDSNYYLQIGVVQERPAPHPAVGFRLIMEYVD
ncbi:SUMF1/EgtB/PvdO family nonheme iron enzyme [Lewinella sp. W8]|uniref:formylglycine-generating enzyme family protein n=1 Tax=Lewinella sp. W8 TaxID=2528208 RepID=UPI0010671C3B|nr:SUMF1/EgtB/PvdO family nonheme iron enzyme [Lewinella sp. W8]MTB49563.1 SUMF1/EgtB/PvdO family nonheme iron enzyme [Lewinella sp. W8]